MFEIDVPEQSLADWDEIQEEIETSQEYDEKEGLDESKMVGNKEHWTD